MESNQQISPSQGNSLDSIAVMDCCRLCMIHRLDANMEFEGIFNGIISKKLWFCTGLRPSETDGLPTQICSKCVVDLYSAYKFKTVCLESDRIFRNLQSQSQVKEESVDHDHNYVSFPQIKEEKINPILQENPKGTSFSTLDDSDGPIQDNLVELVLKEVDEAEQKLVKSEEVLDVIPKTNDLEAGLLTFVSEIKNDEIKPPEPTQPEKPKTTSPKRTSVRRLFCEECQIKFSSRKLSDEHKLMHAPKPRHRQLFCKLCQIKFSTKQLCDEHKLSHRSKTTRRRNYCKRCQIQFASWNLLRNHRNKMHMNDVVDLCCEVCGAVFKSYSTYSTHRKIHSAPGFHCDLCGYAAVRKHDIRKHILAHSGVKEYKCDACPAAYVCQSNLKAHKDRMHRQEKPHACQMCPMKFYEKCKLERHVERQHRGLTRVVSCRECDIHFTRGHRWRSHMAKEHGVDLPKVKPGRKKTDSSDRPDGVHTEEVVQYPYVLVPLGELQRRRRNASPTRRRTRQRIASEDTSADG